MLEILRDAVRDMYVISAPAVDHFLEVGSLRPLPHLNTLRLPSPILRHVCLK